MRAVLRALPVILCAVLALAAPRARGAFHLWQIKELFSNGDGSVQFIEFFTASSGQQFLSGHDLIANSDGVVVDFDFTTIPVVFPETTANRHFLAATPGFATLTGGVAPDFTIPANFFNPNAASISMNFAGGFDQLTIAGLAIPKDGVTSLTDTIIFPNGGDNLVAGMNSPTNFAGAVGSVNVGATPPSAGDFNEDGDVDGVDLTAWQGGFGMQGAGVDHMDGDADDDSDVDGADFLVWQQELGASNAASATASAPEPAGAALAAFAVLGSGRWRRSQSRSSPSARGPG